MSDMLETIRLRGAVFFRWEPRAPFGVGVADGEALGRHIMRDADCVVSYHIVTRGPCWATVRGEEPLRLETGDVLVLPRGDAYKIADSPQYPTAADERDSIDFFRQMAAGKMPLRVSDGGDGEASELICGFLGCNLRPYNPLLSTLPRMLRVPPPPQADDPLASLVEFALSESSRASGGERCLLQRLSETMFVEVLRRYLRQGDKTAAGWLGSLHHPLVGRALAMLHADIAHRWTLAELARRVGASRSVLSEQFARQTGTPPMQYLAQWRMQVAANRLLDESCKIYAIASEVGYESEAAFSRAFKRIVGTTPRDWRDRRRPDSESA